MILAAGRAGTQILSNAQLAAARKLLVALDVNAVPPAGLEGVGAFDDGKAIEGDLGRRRRRARRRQRQVPDRARAAGLDARRRAAPLHRHRRGVRGVPQAGTPGLGGAAADLRPVRPGAGPVGEGRRLRAHGARPVRRPRHARGGRGAAPPSPAGGGAVRARGPAARRRHGWRRRPCRWSGAAGFDGAPGLLAELARAASCWATGRSDAPR